MKCEMNVGSKCAAGNSLYNEAEGKYVGEGSEMDVWRDMRGLRRRMNR